MDKFIHRLNKSLGWKVFQYLDIGIKTIPTDRMEKKNSLHTVYSRLIFIFLLLTGSLPTYSQQKDEIRIEKCARLQSGFLFQTNSEDNSIVPGMDIQYCYGIKTGERLGLGVSAGFQFFKDEFFVPFLMDVVLFIGKDKKNSYLTFDAGYSPGWSERFKNYTNSDFSGGPALGVGFGRKICIKDQYTFFIKTGYQYQNARLSYENEIGENINDPIHYHILIINFGMMIQQ